MPYSNNKITAPVSITDIKTCIGSSANDVGSLCKFSGIKQWSKHKPVILNSLQHNDSDWFHGTNGQCGFTFTFINGNGFTNVSEAFTDGWTYNHPTGGTSSPYRMGDFVGYNHAATCPVSSVSAPSSVQANTSTQTYTFTISMNINNSNDNLQLSDIWSSKYKANKSIGDWYLGTIFETPTGLRLVSNSTKIGSSTGGGGNTIDITVPTSYNGQSMVGNRKFYPVLCEVSTTATTAIETSYGIVPIPNTSAININFANSIPIDITSITGTATKQGTNVSFTLTFNYKNTSSSSKSTTAYFTVRTSDLLYVGNTTSQNVVFPSGSGSITVNTSINVYGTQGADATSFLLVFNPTDTEVVQSKQSEVITL